MISTISNQNIDRVLAFLPLFANPNTKPLYQSQPGTGIFDPYVYATEVAEFLEVLDREGFVIAYDWSACKGEAMRYVDDPALVASADLTTLQKLLTTHVHLEQFFNDGHLAQLIENGHLLAILKRLAQLRSSQEWPQPAGLAYPSRQSDQLQPALV